MTISRPCVVLLLAACASTAEPASTRPASTTPAAAPPAGDGQRDFDGHIGTWKTHITRRLRPLTGSTTWVEYSGTTVVREVWGGRANLVELVATGPAGQLELLSLRLYDAASRQWSMHVGSSGSGELSPPTVGGFANGRGEFYSREVIGGRDVRVRFAVANVDPRTWRFEQAFSTDDGKTWEVNWIATDTR